MPARAIVNQGLVLQREATPGVPLVAATKRVLGLRAMPAWSTETTPFKASGYKVNTSETVETEIGEHSVEPIQDYNAFLWLLTGGFGAPTASALVTATPAATTSYQHTYALNPRASDALVTFTAMWGDTVQALQMAHFFFQSLGITIARGDLSIDSSAKSYKPVTGVAFPTTGVTEIASVPVASRSWDVYADDTWAALGTTKMLEAYEGEVNFGDKYTPDYVLNSAKPSFDSVVENEDTDYDGTLRLGFAATAIGLISTFNNGALKFFRFVSTGPIIEGAIPYSLQINFCARIQSPGEISGDGSVVSLPFDFTLMADPTSGNAATAVLVNKVASLT